MEDWTLFYLCLLSPCGHRASYARKCFFYARQTIPHCAISTLVNSPCLFLLFRKGTGDLQLVIQLTLRFCRLKDSDVTWLYGPLHTAVDWTPPPKPKPDPTSVDDKLPSSAHDRLDLNLGAGGKKPILKHRSICELLTSDLPSSPIFSSPSSDAGEEEDLWVQGSDASDGATKVKAERPPLLHTKSDTHITRWPNRAFRKESPPRIIAEDTEIATDSAPSENPYRSWRKSSSTTPRAHSQTSGSDQDPTAPGNAGIGKKKHITFNTFVEQYIAIEKPKGDEYGADTPRNNRRAYENTYDDGSVFPYMLFTEGIAL